MSALMDIKFLNKGEINMKLINMKLINKQTKLIKVIVISLILLGSVFSLVGCNNSSSTAGGNISGDASSSSGANPDENSSTDSDSSIGESQTDDSSSVAEELFNYKDIEFSLCDYSISFPKNWREDIASNSMSVCGNMDMKQKERDYFIIGGYSERFMELPTSFDDIVDAFKPYLADGITAIRLHRMEQTVEKKEEVEVNGRKMLKVEGRMKGKNTNLWSEEKPNWDFKYYAYYTFIDSKSPSLQLENCPILWIGMTELEENYEIMERYVDEAAKTVKNLEW